MNYTKQAEKMFSNWNEMQKQALNNWQNFLQSDMNSFSPTELWQKSLQAWEETVHKSVATHAELMDVWVSSLKEQENVPAEFVQWAEQTQSMHAQFAENQDKLWKSWFELMKKVQPDQAVSSLEEESRKAYKVWQESFQKIIEAQSNWVEKMTERVEN